MSGEQADPGGSNPGEDAGEPGAYIDDPDVDGDDPYQVMPELDAEEYERLKADIAEHGVEYPIILDGDGEIIDGHHRYRAWVDLGRDPDDLPTRVVDDTDAENYHRAYRANLLRRDLTDGTKREVVKQYLLEHPERVAEDTQEAIASDLGVSRSLVTQVVNDEDVKDVTPNELSTEEKRQQVRAYLNEHPDASNREVAREVDCDVSHVTVGNWRDEWGDTREATTGLDTFTNSKAEAETVLDVVDAATDAEADDEVRETAAKKAAEITEGKTSPDDAAAEVDRTKDIVEDEQRREQQRQEFKKAVADADAVDVHHGAFVDVLADYEAESIDHIVTDPPYGEAYFDVWQDLGRVAARVLKPGGFLAAYSGQYLLPDVLQTLGEHLEYYWQFVTLDNQPTFFIEKRIGIRYKPVVVFAKPPTEELDKQAHDVIDVGERAKDHHKWEQPVEKAAALIEALSEPNDLICDPMCGSGTTGVAALAHDRRTVLIDRDEEAVETTRQRIGEVIDK